MISKKLKILIGFIILWILVCIAVFFFCQPNLDSNESLKPGYGIVNDSQFQIETGWYQDISTGYENSAKLKFNGSTGNSVLMIMVDQYNDRSTYDAQYEAQSQKNEWYVTSTETVTKEGLSVKTIQVTRDNARETVKYYFFEKNGKYYQILIDVAGTSDTSQFFTNDKYKLDKTINKIIRTID